MRKSRVRPPDLETALCRSERALAREMGDLLVLIHVDTGEYFTLNDVGARVWGLCDGTNTVARVAEMLSTEFDAPRDVITADLVELVTELVEECLLVVAP